MDRDPYSKQQLRFERGEMQANPIEGPEDRPNAGDTFVGGFIIGGLLGAFITWCIERMV